MIWIYKCPFFFIPFHFLLESINNTYTTLVSNSEGRGLEVDSRTDTSLINNILVLESSILYVLYPHAFLLSTHIVVGSIYGIEFNIYKIHSPSLNNLLTIDMLFYFLSMALASKLLTFCDEFLISFLCTPNI